jgi:hypothetical protein
MIIDIAQRSGVIPVHYPADNRVVTLAELTRWAGRSGS